MVVVVIEDPEQIDRWVVYVLGCHTKMPIHARAKDRQHFADLIIRVVPPELWLKLWKQVCV